MATTRMLLANSIASCSRLTRLGLLCQLQFVIYSAAEQGLKSKWIRATKLQLQVALVVVVVVLAVIVGHSIKGFAGCLCVCVF